MVEKRGGISIDEYINRETKLKIRCKNGHTFSSRPDHVKEGRWCLTCNESKGELLVFNILTELGLPFEREYTLPELNKCYYDFLTFYNNKHVFIEFDGKQYFEYSLFNRTEEDFEVCRERDIKKTKLVVEKYKLRMIRISYRALENKWVSGANLGCD